MVSGRRRYSYGRREKAEQSPLVTTRNNSARLTLALALAMAATDHHSGTSPRRLLRDLYGPGSIKSRRSRLGEAPERLSLAAVATTAHVSRADPFGENTK